MEDDFGPHLKEAREARGLSLRQLATVTKISVVALESLERGDFSRLPGGIFSRAFVRAYAIEVGLDPEQTVQTFLAEFERTERRRAHERPKPEVTADDRAFLERQRKARQLLRAGLIWIAVTVVAVVVWKVMSRATPARSAAVVQTATAASDPALRAPLTAASSSPDVGRPEAGAAAAPDTPPPAAAAAPADGSFALHLTISGDCWVRATVDNVVRFEQILKAGDVQDLPAGHDIYLQVGNAGVVSWTINGQPAKPLGNPGEPSTARVTSATVARYLQ